MTGGEAGHRASSSMERAGCFLVFVGLVMLALGLGLDDPPSVSALPPVAVTVLAQASNAQWVVYRLSAAYHARRWVDLDPRHLVFWGAVALLVGWLFWQRSRVATEEMDSARLARRRRLFRRGA